MRLFALVTSLLVASALLADGPNVPRHAPEFVLNMPDGSTKLLSSFRGKVVALSFIQTTCPHCQHASQVFSKLYTEYGSKGFEPISVAWNPMAKMLVADFIKQNNVNYPVAYAERDPVLDFLQFSPMMRTVVPQIVWIDRKGTIRSQTPPEGEEKLLQEAYWRQMIDQLTSEHDTAPKKVSHAAPHKSASTN